MQRSRLERYRNEDGIVLVRRAFIMDESVNSDIINGDFLIKIRNDLDTLRAAKFTTVLRFHYTSTYVRP